MNGFRKSLILKGCWVVRAVLFIVLLLCTIPLWILEGLGQFLKAGGYMVSSLAESLYFAIERPIRATLRWIHEKERQA